MAGIFYGICFDEAAREYTITVTPVNCTLSNITAVTQAQTEALGEPWRLQITATGANPAVVITTNVPTGKRTRVIALLGVTQVSGGGAGFLVGPATSAPSACTLSDRLTSCAFVTSDEDILITPISMSVSEVRVIDIGRIWFSNIARVYGGPFEEWTDGGTDSGRFVETDGFQGQGFALSTRNAFSIPLSVVTEADMYAGTGTGQSQYASVKEAVMHAGTHDQILVGSFSLETTDVYKATSDLYGVDALTYGRLVEIPTISRIGGPTYGCTLNFEELK